MLLAAVAEELLLLPLVLLLLAPADISQLLGCVAKLPAPAAAPL